MSRQFLSQKIIMTVLCAFIDITFLCVFSQSDEEHGYGEKIHKMLQENRTRLIVDLDDIRAFDQKLADDLMARPVDFHAAFEAALNHVRVNRFRTLHR